MRITLILFLSITAVVFLLATYGIFNTYVSIKYEIEPYELKNADQTILDKSGLYRNLLICLWTIICLCTLSAGLLVEKLIYRHPSKNDLKLSDTV